jgi:hypothetical protein
MHTGIPRDSGSIDTPGDIMNPCIIGIREVSHSGKASGNIFGMKKKVFPDMFPGKISQGDFS